MKKKFKLLAFIALMTTYYSNAQMGINTKFPDASAALEIKSPDNTKGVLMPRSTTTQINAIPLPAEGLIVYDTTQHCFLQNAGTAAIPNWVPLINAADNGLTVTGSKIQLGGTLTKPSVITATATNTLAISGLQTGADADNVMVTDANGVLKTVSRSSFTGADNLGNHIATQNLMMNRNDVVFSDRSLLTNNNTFSLFKDNKVFGVYNSVKSSNSIAVTENGNVGIGTSNPDASAILDISSSNQGLLVPRVSLTSATDNTTIPSPATSLIAYNTNEAMTNGNGVGLYTNTGTAAVPSWAPFAVGVAQSVSGQIMRYPCAPLTLTGAVTVKMAFLKTYIQPNGANGAINGITGASLSGTGDFSLPPGTYRVDTVISGGWSTDPSINSGAWQVLVNNQLYADHLFTAGATLSDVITLEGTSNSTVVFNLKSLGNTFTLDSTISGKSSRSIIIITRLK